MSDLVIQNGLTQDQIDLIKRTIAKDTTDDELKLFIQNCNRTSLDPFARQIYCIKRGGKITIQISIDGARLIAERSKKYSGQLGPFWCGLDGKWTDVWLEKSPPSAAKVGVLRSDFKEPLWAVANFEAYKPQYSSMWDKMPALMIAKCSEALALRKAFPQELSGLYTSEEMEQSSPLEPEKLSIANEQKERPELLLQLIEKYNQKPRTEKTVEWVYNLNSEILEATIKEFENKLKSTVQ
jgi:phage recombination protein Bet